jgi:hypothetical protein
MEDKISRLRSSCSEINFGAVNLPEEEKQFCREWNHEIISLCKSLPASTQTDALLFFIRYCKGSFEEINFFRMYYVPSWSIIYWLIRCCPHNGKLDHQDVKNAKAAHFMAMFLHALDDHLRDHQVPVTHLALLLRSHSWVIMNSAARNLAAELKNGERIIENFIDDYYCSIRSEKELKSLDDYCEHFRKQMATWFIVPIILTKKINHDEAFPRAVQSAYGSFGIAWRLLDDIQDMEIDMNNGIPSAIFVCLPEEMQKLWLMQPARNSQDKRRFLESVTDHILQKDIIGTLKQKICSELKSAAAIASDYHLTGLADEFDCLSRPLT